MKLISGPEAPQILDTLDRAAVGLALEQVGGAQATLDIWVEYLKTRVQFGQPIGAFPALKHMAAGVFVDVETARCDGDG